MESSMMLTEQPPYLKCSLCRMVMKDPVECPQQHPFCFRCLKEYLASGGHTTCPVDNQPLSMSSIVKSPLAENLISSMPVKCQHSTAGCDWKGKANDYDQHILSCKFRPSPPTPPPVQQPTPQQQPPQIMPVQYPSVQMMQSPYFLPPPPGSRPTITTSTLPPPHQIPQQPQQPQQLLQSIPPIMTPTATQMLPPPPPEPAPVLAPPPISSMLTSSVIAQQQQEEEELVACLNPGCSERLKKSQLKAHLSKCPAAVISCPFTGCPVKMSRQDMMGKHIMEQSPLHLLALFNSVQGLHQRLDRLVGTVEENSANARNSLLAWDLSRSSPQATVSSDGCVAKIVGTPVPTASAPKQWYTCVANSSFSSGSIVWELSTQSSCPEDTMIGLCPEDDLDKLVKTTHPQHVGAFGCAIDLFTGRLLCKPPCQAHLVAVPVPLGGFNGKKVMLRLDIGGDTDGTLSLVTASSQTAVLLFSNLSSLRSALVPVVCAQSEGRVITLHTSDRSPARETLLDAVTAMEERLQRVELITSVTKPTLTWDPARCASTLMLTEGNLCVTCGANVTQGSVACLAAGRGFLAGRIYWELSLVGHSWIGISFADHATALNHSGTQDYGCGMYTGDGTLRARKPIISCMEKFSVPLGGWEKQRIGVFVDLNQGTLSFTCNGQTLGMAFQGIPRFTEVIPSVSLLVRGSSVRIMPFA